MTTAGFIHTTANGHSRNATAVSVATYISVKCALDYNQALIRDIIIINNLLYCVRSRDPQPHPSVLPSETTSEKRRRGEFSKRARDF